MDGGMPVDLDEVIDNTMSVLDDLWRANSFIYPQKRMEMLMNVIGNSIAFYFQEKLSKMNVWSDDFNAVIDLIDSASVSSRSNSTD